MGIKKEITIKPNIAFFSLAVFLMVKYNKNKDKSINKTFIIYPEYNGAIFNIKPTLINTTKRENNIILFGNSWKYSGYESKLLVPVKTKSSALLNTTPKSQDGFTDNCFNTKIWRSDTIKK